MKRTVAVLMFLFVVLLGALFPFEKTKAAEMSETFYNEQGKKEGGNFKIGKDYLELSAINANDTKVGLNLKMNVLGNPAVDLNKNGKFDANEANDSDAAQTWDSVFDNDLEDSSDGIFLVLTKKNASGQYVLEKITTGIKEVDTDSYHEKANDSSVNIGYLIYGKDPTKFFGKTSLNINIPLVGLDKSTEYKAYIVVYEDGSLDEAIGNEITFKTLSDADTNVKDTEGGAQDPDSDQVAKAADMNSADLDCSIVTDGFVFCSAVFFYSVSTYVTGLILSGAAMLFDAFVLLSINSDIYNTDKAVFVYTGWKIVKDISNIFFIFVLLYTAIGTMLGLHDVNYKKVIVQVIMMGLLINFSLFFTRVIIDTGNVFAQVFYNAITIDGATDTPIKNLGNVKQKSISRGIQKGINPQKILFVSSGDVKEAAKIHTGQVFLIALVVSAFNLVMAWVFFMSAAFFVGRIGVLWMSMLFSPLAFASNLLPSLDKGLKQLGMHQWLSGLMSASFKAPIFMFLIYIIITLTQGAFIKTIVAATSNSNSTVGTIIAVLVPMMIIMGLLMQAKNIAKDMAGQFGEVADGVMKAAVGVGAMAITGGAAALGSRTLGSVANNYANNEERMNALKDKASKGGMSGWLAMKQLQTIDTAKKGSFDIRQTGLGNALSKATGVNMDAGSSIPGLRTFATANTAGGFEGMANRQAKELQDKAEFLKTKPKESDKKAIKEREDLIADAEQEREKIQERIEERKAKGEPADKQDGDALEAINKYIRVAKNGGTLDAADMTKVAQIQGINKNLVETKDSSGNTAQRTLNYTAAKYDDHGHIIQGQTQNMSLAKQKSAVDDSDKKYVREFYKNEMEKAGAELHGVKRDVLGNLSDIGHATRNQVRGSWREQGWSVGKNLMKGITAGMIVGGPMGAAIGAAGFGLASLFTSSFKEGIVGQIGTGKLQYEAVHIASDPSHKPHLSHSSYKSPNKGIFDMFSGLGSGGGHGGGGHGHDDHGHDDHGGGHDDHGGHH